jgi:hypothetical protein
MDAALPSRATVSSHDFFTRARTRLSLEIPAALNDHAAEGTRGDLISIHFWERAGVQATRPAAVPVPVIDRADPRCCPLRTAAEPSRPDRFSRRQDRPA